jgi:Asp-tRNA(Asn)/Glu-tRNA(Gln) amidotransferase A subunit family amidase
VFGLKPQRARIPLAPFMHEEWGGLDVYGPITRAVADAALFLDATAGPAMGDPYWVESPRASFLSACGEEPRLRVAVTYERDGEAVDPATKDAARATADLLATLGHAVTEAAPDLMPLQEGFLMLSTVGIGQRPLTDEQRDKIEARTRMIFDAATFVPAVDYVRALDRMHAAAREAIAFFDDYDVLLTPTISRPAPVIGEVGATLETAWDDYRNWLCWTWPFNATGQPAASVPAGFDASGLPLGVQIVGRPADERTVLSVAAQLERARPWATTLPPIW